MTAPSRYSAYKNILPIGHNEVDEDDKEIVGENCGVALMVYENGSTEPISEEVL
jgi:hypothetical protein